MPERPKAAIRELQDEHITNGLPEAFDRQGLRNLLPSCRLCNQQKLDNPLLIGQIAILIAKATERVAQVEYLRTKYKRETEQTKVQLGLLRSLASGKISKNDVERWLRGNDGDVSIFRFENEGLSLGLESLKEISTHQIDDAMDAPIKFASGMGDSLRLVKDSKEVRVRTLREYTRAVKNGFNAQTNAEMITQAGYFETPLQILRLVKNAGIASTSFIDEPLMGLADLDYLPVGLLFSVSEMTDDPLAIEALKRPQSVSIGELLLRDEIKIVRLGSKFIEIEDEFYFTLLVEVMRADFDGDGIQDLLIQRVCGPKDGTFRNISTVAITRKGNSELFEIIQEQTTNEPLEH